MQRKKFKPNVDKVKHGLIEREISHFGSKRARVTVCVRRIQFWFDSLLCLGFSLFKWEGRKKRMEKES